MYDTIIIGGGAAGLSAAIYSARNKFKTLVIDKGFEHGNAGTLAKITDFPGIDENISGAEFLNKMKKQAINFGADHKNAQATSCTIKEDIKQVTTNEPATYESKVILLATGNQPYGDSHTYAGERELRGKGVSHDPDADANACKQCAIAIIGKSQSVAETALKLSRTAEKIYWIIPASKLDLPQELKNELEAAKRIEPFFSSSLRKINGIHEVSSVTILTAGQEKTLTVKYIFLPHQQYKPTTDYLNGTGVQTSPEGVVMVNEQFETSVPGVFAVGNILCLKPQINVICSAQGTIAAMNSERYLK
ncbi:MAG: hypothetical protein COV46_01030 [Deltaproteobacteria bacterium CG11_big_fil_rev_8_21_14_0_20_49_13]|nr:MAG: hypothetical protein COV46_01030 [Deltaproteobacteria bacterium CG11_big_fil_rev_8_21_14_0_20_49_13]